MNTLEQVDTALDDQLDFTPELPCEGQEHQAGTSGHMVDAPGTILVQGPCCRTKILHCAPRAAQMRCQDTLRCGKCDVAHPVAEYTFTRV